MIVTLLNYVLLIVFDTEIDDIDDNENNAMGDIDDNENSAIDDIDDNENSAIDDNDDENNAMDDDNESSSSLSQENFVNNSTVDSGRSVLGDISNIVNSLNERENFSSPCPRFSMHDLPFYNAGDDGNEMSTEPKFENNTSHRQSILEDHSSNFDEDVIRVNDEDKQREATSELTFVTKNNSFCFIIQI